MKEKGSQKGIDVFVFMFLFMILRFREKKVIKKVFYVFRCIYALTWAFASNLALLVASLNREKYKIEFLDDYIGRENFLKATFRFWNYGLFSLEQRKKNIKLIFDASSAIFMNMYDHKIIRMKTKLLYVKVWNLRVFSITRRNFRNG